MIGCMLRVAFDFRSKFFLTKVDSQFLLSSTARRHWKLRINLQSWTKVLGTVLQYSYFSVISQFPHKTVHPFRNFLAVLSPPPYTKLKLGKKFWINSSNIFCEVRGGVGPVLIGKYPRNAKVSQDFCP